jgi:hypothetical protein
MEKLEQSIRTCNKMLRYNITFDILFEYRHRKFKHIYFIVILRIKLL